MCRRCANGGTPVCVQGKGCGSVPVLGAKTGGCDGLSSAASFAVHFAATHALN